VKHVNENKEEELFKVKESLAKLNAEKNVAVDAMVDLLRLLSEGKTVVCGGNKEALVTSLPQLSSHQHEGSCSGSNHNVAMRIETKESKAASKENPTGATSSKLISSSLLNAINNVSEAFQKRLREQELSRRAWEEEKIRLKGEMEPFWNKDKEIKQIEQAQQLLSAKEMTRKALEDLESTQKLLKRTKDCQAADAKHIEEVHKANLTALKEAHESTIRRISNAVVHAKEQEIRARATHLNFWCAGRVPKPFVDSLPNFSILVKLSLFTHVYAMRSFRERTCVMCVRWHGLWQDLLSEREAETQRELEGLRAENERLKEKLRESNEANNQASKNKEFRYLPLKRALTASSTQPTSKDHVYLTLKEDANGRQQSDNYIAERPRLNSVYDCPATTFLHEGGGCTAVGNKTQSDIVKDKGDDDDGSGKCDCIDGESSHGSVRQFLQKLHHSSSSFSLQSAAGVREQFRERSKKDNLPPSPAPFSGRNVIPIAATCATNQRNPSSVADTSGRITEETVSKRKAPSRRRRVDRHVRCTIQQEAAAMGNEGREGELAVHEAVAKTESDHCRHSDHTVNLLDGIQSSEWSFSIDPDTGAQVMALFGNTVKNAITVNELHATHDLGSDCEAISGDEEDASAATCSKHRGKEVESLLQQEETRARDARGLQHPQHVAGFTSSCHQRFTTNMLGAPSAADSCAMCDHHCPPGNSCNDHCDEGFSSQGDHDEKINETSTTHRFAKAPLQRCGQLSLASKRTSSDEQPAHNRWDVAMRQSNDSQQRIRASLEHVEVEITKMLDSLPPSRWHDAALVHR